MRKIPKGSDLWEMGAYIRTGRTFALSKVRRLKSESPETLETNLASRREGVRLPRASGKSLDFPGSSPNFPGSFSATSPEVLSLWNLTTIQGFPGSFPDFPGSSPDFPGSLPDFPRGQPCLWEAWHALPTRKNFLWISLLSAPKWLQFQFLTD